MAQGKFTTCEWEKLERIIRSPRHPQILLVDPGALWLLSSCCDFIRKGPTRLVEWVKLNGSRNRSTGLFAHNILHVHGRLSVWFRLTESVVGYDRCKLKMKYRRMEAPGVFNYAVIYNTILWIFFHTFWINLMRLFPFGLQEIIT